VARDFHDRRLREMLDHGAKAAVMEVSSHALDQGRVSYIEFDGAIFTNITSDHLDYHLTVDNYREAKAKLFCHLRRGPAYPYDSNVEEKDAPISQANIQGVAAINIDCPECVKLLDRCPSNTIRYGLSAEADFYATNIDYSLSRTRFIVHYEGHHYPVSSPLVGIHNVYNLLSGAACLVKMGYELGSLLKAMETFKPVAGRLEPVVRASDGSLPFQVLVDYAHTHDALQNVLACVKPLTKGKLILIFGCGGDRDRTKRPRMAHVAEKFADEIIVTSDNPRTEDPEQILNEIYAGFRDPKKPRRIADRHEAIVAGVKALTPGSILLIAGKGHETYQIFRDRTIDFDDVAIAREALVAAGHLPKK